jgi:hypothetical protein
VGWGIDYFFVKDGFSDQVLTQILMMKSWAPTIALYQ